MRLLACRLLHFHLVFLLAQRFQPFLFLGQQVLGLPSGDVARIEKLFLQAGLPVKIILRELIVMMFTDYMLPLARRKIGL